MPFSSIQDHNPFAYSAILFLALLALRKFILRNTQWIHYMRRQKSTYKTLAFNLAIDRRTSYVLQGLIALSLFLYIIFEIYFSYGQCFVSTRYYNENIRLARDVITVLATAGQPYWLEYATLLSQMRGYAVNPWDHDADYSTIYPGTWANIGSNSEAVTELDSLLPKEQRPISTLDELLKLFKDASLYYIYEEKRHLIQVYNSERHKGPHIDIWLWEIMLGDEDQYSTSEALVPERSRDIRENAVKSHDGEYLMIDTRDHEGVYYRPRPMSDVFPLKSVVWTDVSDSSYIPAKSRKVSDAEFTRYGGDYMDPQVFRGDCFHNFFNLRWMY
jgi:hypothetical protein